MDRCREVGLDKPYPLCHNGSGGTVEVSVATTWHQVAPQVVREIFDDEVIVINMKSGNYFSLNPTGARVWTLIEAGLTVERIISRMGDEYEDADSQAASSVTELVGKLLDEELIQGGTGDAPESHVAEAFAVATKEPFVKPQLSVYTDMQELLLLDPIHDVDETGWPQRQDEPKA